MSLCEKIAAAASYFAHLQRARIFQPHSGADSVPVRRPTRKLQHDPVVPRIRVIAEERRPLVHVRDEDVCIAVVVEIAERGAAARSFDEQRASDFFRSVPETTRADVDEHLLPLTVRRATSRAIHLGIHVAVGDEEGEAAVIVEVSEPGAPPEVGECRRHDAGPVADIGEEPGLAVLVQRVVVL
jgi:hypothetical protein